MRGHSTMFFYECQITPDWLGHVRTEQFEQNGWPTGFPIQSWNSLPATCGKWLSPFHWWHRPVVNSFHKLTQSQIRKYWYVRRYPWKKYWLLWLSNQGYSIFLSNYWNIYFLLSNFRKLSIVQQSSVSTKMVSLLSFTIALQRALVKRATFLCLCYSSAQ